MQIRLEDIQADPEARQEAVSHFHPASYRGKRCYARPGGCYKLQELHHIGEVPFSDGVTVLNIESGFCRKDAEERDYLEFNN